MRRNELDKGTERNARRFFPFSSVLHLLLTPYQCAQRSRDVLWCCLLRASAQRHPEVVWAQRSDRVFMTIDLADAQDVKVEYTSEGKLTFSATAGPEDLSYTLDFDLFEGINVEVRGAPCT